MSTTTKTRLLPVVKVTALFLLLGGMGYGYWQIRTVDPEGGCKEVRNLSLCFDAWSQYSGSFKPLPSDQEMIDRFKKYRGDFDEIRDDALGNHGRINGLTWRERHGIWVAEWYAIYPPFPDYAGQKLNKPPRVWAYSFPVDSTKYIKEASRKDWPWVNRLKGYLYFDMPPQVKDGRLVGLPDKDDKPKYQDRVMESLDGPPWPSDWASNECLLRQIEPQWFLFLCRDHVGG